MLILATGAGLVIAQQVGSASHAAAAVGTTTTVKVPAAAVAGALVQLSATVTPAPLNDPKQATQGLTFVIDGGAIPGSPVRHGAGRYSWSTSAIPVGTHSVVANFTGDATHSASSSAPASITIGQAGANAATMTFTASPTNPTGGMPVTLSVTMTGKPGIANPTGSVTFKNGTAVLTAGRSLTNGAVSYQASSLPLGTNTLSAIYSGDVNYASVTQPMSITVTAAPNDKFLTHLYTDLIGMQDTSGEAFWASQLNKGMARSTVAASFTQTGQYRGIVINQLYLHELGRPATTDPGGATFWADQLRTHTPEFIAASLVASDELYKSPSFGNGDNDTYIQAVYHALLGRGADPGGAAFWHNYLLNHPRWQLTVGFTGGPEWAGITVDRMYALYHLGTPDPNARAFWAGRLLAGVPDAQLAATLVSSDQYFTWAQSN